MAPRLWLWFWLWLWLLLLLLLWLVLFYRGSDKYISYHFIHVHFFLSMLDLFYPKNLLDLFLSILGQP